VTRGILRLSLKSVTVESNGDVPEDKNPEAASKDKNNVLVASLRYPRSGAPSVASTMKMNLESGVTLAFDTSNFWESGLFKEEVDGETVLKLQVLDRDVPGKLTKLFATLFGTIFKAGLGVLTGGISNAIVGAVAALPAEAFASTFKVDGETFTVLGEGELALQAGGIPPQIAIYLVAPVDVSKEYFDQEAPGSTKIVKRTRKLLTKGQKSGTVALQAAWEPL
jgi:hypothetical protein